MSKRDLKNYLNKLSKEQLEEQLFELYEKFKEVKIYYDFAFNPNEDKLINEAKVKTANEYFPARGKRPKMRRSVAQKFIKHFITLGVDSFMVSDFMLFNIETAIKFSARKQVKQEAFFKSMLSMYIQSVNFMIENAILNDFWERVVEVKEEVNRQNWLNKEAFNNFVEKINDNFM